MGLRYKAPYFVVDTEKHIGRQKFCIFLCMNIMQPLGKSREYLMKKGISNACLIARLWFYTDDNGKHSPLSPPEISYFIHDRGKSPASETPWQVSIPDVLSDLRYGTEARLFSYIYRNV